MTPPGLTCSRCQQPLYPNLAKRTDEGWQHKRLCPRQGCVIDGCERAHHARGYCYMHDRRIRRNGTPFIDKGARLEDLRWMAETGECLIGAAQRLGISVRGLELFLVRSEERELLAMLTRRNPRDHNKQAEQSLATHVSGYAQDKARWKGKARQMEGAA